MDTHLKTTCLSKSRPWFSRLFSIWMCCGWVSDTRLCISQVSLAARKCWGKQVATSQLEQGWLYRQQRSSIGAFWLTGLPVRTDMGGRGSSERGVYSLCILIFHLVLKDHHNLVFLSQFNIFSHLPQSCTLSPPFS